MVLCWMPSDNLPSSEDFNDKTAHFIAFAGWSFCWLFAFKNWKNTLFLGIFFGVIIEIGQYLLPEVFHRSFDTLDILADSIGVILGLLVNIAWKRLMA